MENKLIKGCAIALEGNEGTGKTTVANKLVEYFNECNIPTVYIKEPGGNDLAEQIRHLILYNEIDNISEMLLYYAARSVNMYNNIMPALNDGKLLIMDRFIDSSMVYQALVNGNDPGAIEKLNRIVVWANGFYEYPFLRILIDCPVEVLQSRLDNEGREHNKYDLKPKEYLEKISKEYRWHFKRISRIKENNAYIINGDCEPEELFNRLKDSIMYFINSKELIK